MKFIVLDKILEISQKNNLGIVCPVVSTKIRIFRNKYAETIRRFNFYVIFNIASNTINVTKKDVLVKNQDKSFKKIFPESFGIK